VTSIHFTLHRESFADSFSKSFPDQRSTRGRDSIMIVLRNGHVITMDPQLGELPATDVLISGDRIQAIGPGLPADGATEIDIRGEVVLPGFATMAGPDTFRRLRAALRVERTGACTRAPDSRPVTEAATETLRTAGNGAISVGGRADLVTLGGLEHVMDVSRLAGAVITSLGPDDVRTVMIGGRIVRGGLAPAASLAA
jgi:cytosine/adenosine deaminase-related metal-dependent hydrolase